MCRSRSLDRYDVAHHHVVSLPRDAGDRRHQDHGEGDTAIFQFVFQLTYSSLFYYVLVL